MSTDAASSTPLPDDVAALRALLLAERERFDAERRRVAAERGRECEVFERQRETIEQLRDRFDAQRERIEAERDRERALHERTVAELSQTIEAQQRTIAQQEHRLAQLLRQRFGPRQERIDPGQLLLFDAAEIEAIVRELNASRNDESNGDQSNGDEPAPDESPDDPAGDSSSKKKRAGHGRRPLPPHLPRERRRHELTDEERRCPCCCGLRAEIGAETSEQLEYVPASYKVIEHVRVKYACRACEEHVARAAKPPQPVAKGLPGPGLLAHTVLAKYGDHLPLYRQEDIAARHGVTIRRSTQCGWIAAAADLAAPLVDLMRSLVVQSRIVHTDDTPVRLLVPRLGRAQTARFWAYVGDRAHPYTVYDFTESRTRDGPARFLQDFRGYLQADAYGGYDGLYAGARGAIVEVACWAHARRYWWEAKTHHPPEAHHAMGTIARLYQIEALARDLSCEQRRALRDEHARPLLDDFRVWLDEQSPRLLPKSLLGQAATYTLNQWDALRRYTEDGELSIDNNLSERTVKIVAMGRKAWLFVASPAGGRRAATLFGLIASAKANHVEPWAWLQDLFARLPELPADPAARHAELEALLPDRWLAAHPDHRWLIDDLRREERRRRQPLRPRRKPR